MNVIHRNCIKSNYYYIINIQIVNIQIEIVSKLFLNQCYSEFSLSSVKEF